MFNHFCYSIRQNYGILIIVGDSMHRSKRKRNVIIFSLVGVLLCMVAGYAAFQTQLKVTGTSKVTSNWDIEITNVTAGTPTGSAENAVAPDWDKLTASMEANLYDKGDAMEYDVTLLKIKER